MSVRVQHRRCIALAGLLLACGCEGLIEGGPARPGPARTGPSCEICLGESELNRVTRLEYESAVRGALGDLVAAEIRFDYLPPDGSAGPFASNASLDVDDDGVEAYRVVAEAIGAAAAPRADELMGCVATDATDACVDQFLRTTGRVFFRRPLEAEDLAPYQQLFRDVRVAQGAPAALRLVVTAMLQSPWFLYRPERGIPTAVDGVVALDGNELAARLAAFLWRSSPDASLAQAADEGRLDSREGVMEEARQMLLDARANVSIARFHTSWLGMEQVPTLFVDESEYPEFEALRQDMYDETGRFAVDVFRDDARLETLLTASYTVASPRLAAFYGLAPPDADGRVETDPRQRSGILTHAGFLASHTPSPSTAGIHRGRLIREEFLCQHLPSPPPIDTVIAPDPMLSARQQLEQKTAPALCTACHRLMNPVGFLFEHYDRIGRFRSMDGPFVVDATGDVLESDLEGALDGAVELGEALSQSDQVQRCVARQWMRYALGRRETPADEISLNVAYAHYLDSGGDLRELIVAIAGSDSFRYRRYRDPAVSE